MLLKQMLDMVVQQGIYATDVEAGSVWLLRKDQGMITPVAALGPKAAGITGFWLKAGEGIVGRVIAENQEIVLEEVKEDPAWAFYFDNFSGFHSSSVLCVPLLRGDTPVGALQLLNKRGGRFTEGDLILARSLAREALAVIQRGHLMDVAEG